MKGESLSGIAIHSTVVLGCNLLLPLVYGAKAVIPALIISVAHFFIDWLKLATSKVFIKRGLEYFIADQLMHIVTIWVTSLLFEASVWKALVSFNIPISVLYAVCGGITLAWTNTIIVKIIIARFFFGNSPPVIDNKERFMDGITSLIFYLIFVTSANGSIILPIIFVLLSGVQILTLKYTKHFSAYPPDKVKSIFWFKMIWFTLCGVTVAVPLFLFR